ncbi:MAG: class I SAM-dependent methyltransferase [Flavobacteriales bacterium]|nr:class I SAM-dependent methyltransferase [Flavobacteriales bacterium]
MTSELGPRYSFKSIKTCNMCGSGPEQHDLMGQRLNGSQGSRPWKKKGVTTSVQKCKRCKLIFSDPMPIPLDLQDHYGVPPENYWVDGYFKVEENYFGHNLNRFRSLMEFKPGMTALDVGAGIGKAMIALNKAGFDTYGFEPSEPFRSRAIERMGIDPDRIQLGDIESIEYPEGKFDLISFGAVLEHLYDPSFCLGKAMRWLKPGGLVQIEVPSSQWLIHRLINASYAIRGSNYVANLSSMHPPYHLHEFGVKSFEENGKVNGYGIAFHEFYICQTFMPSILDGPLKCIMRRSGTGMQLSIWLRKS